MKEMSGFEKDKTTTTTTTTTTTYYQVLGIDDEKADLTFIKNAHRRLALRYHPDKTMGKINATSTSTTTTADELELMFTRIQTAWECLSNEERRMEYDDSLKRIRERNTADMARAEIVKLSEMDCELCDVAEEEEEDDDDDDGEIEQRKTEKLYTYNCRCGDIFEILEGDLDDFNSSEPDSNIFVCESCSLSIKLVS
jgi:curved DNA-binding protein CbpA